MSEETKFVLEYFEDFIDDLEQDTNSLVKFTKEYMRLKKYLKNKYPYYPKGLPQTYLFEELQVSQEHFKAIKAQIRRELGTKQTPALIPLSLCVEIIIALNEVNE